METYNRSFEQITTEFDEDNRLRSIRAHFFTNLIDKLNKRQREWDATFRELLKKSQECDEITLAPAVLGQELKLPDLLLSPPKQPQQQPPQDTPLQLTKTSSSSPDKQQSSTQIDKPAAQEPVVKLEPKKKEKEADNDDPRFSNSKSIEEFIRIRNLLDKTRESVVDLSTNPALKQHKNELNLFIRTQINSISNSDSQHLDTKIRLLTSLFKGNKVNFQDRLIDASQHPQGQLFSMDLAAQTFVLVGTRLVNSVPAIAKSMAIVINGVAKNDLPLFNDLVTGHLQERCPYLIPTLMHPKADQTTNKVSGDMGQEVGYKIACGYSYDFKTKTLESEEKYLGRMRSMALIYACVLTQGHMYRSWTWLASFLTLKPQPVISATILQAFLQESSKQLSSTYGRQYSKLLALIRNHYVKMIEEKTPKTSDRQSLVKLQNLLSDDSNLIAGPSPGSIFGAIRLG